MSPTERYVYIDGTKDSWDIKCRRRVPEGAMRMALGDAYGMWLNSPDRRTVDMQHIVFDPRMTKDPEVYINTFEGCLWSRSMHRTNAVPCARCLVFVQPRRSGN